MNQEFGELVRQLFDVQVYPDLKDDNGGPEPGDVVAGNLASRFDVIVFASDRAGSITDGYPIGRVPPTMEGRLGAIGVSALDGFVQDGGTVVAMNASAGFAVGALHLPVRNVVAGLRSNEFFASGSILEVITDTVHPVMAGMRPRAKVFVDGSPAFMPMPGFEGIALARYGSSGSPLRSGQTVGTFRVVFNAALFSQAVGREAGATPGFWPAPHQRRRRIATEAVEWGSVRQ